MRLARRTSENCPVGLCTGSVVISPGLSTYVAV